MYRGQQVTLEHAVCLTCEVILLTLVYLLQLETRCQKVYLSTAATHLPLVCHKNQVILCQLVYLSATVILDREVYLRRLETHCQEVYLTLQEANLG